MAKKYIDANQLKAEIERLYDGEAPKHDQQCDWDDGYFTGIGAISKFLDKLQEPENPIYELNQFLINWVRDGQTDAEKDARWEAYRRFFELHDEAMMQESNTADEKAVKEIVKITHKEVTRQIKEMVEGLQEPEVDGLEEEIARYLREECSADDEPSISEIARHFAEWGATHLKR